VSLIGFSAPLIYARGQASLCDASRDSGRPRDCRSCVSVGSRLLFVCAAAPAEWPQSLPRELARAFRTPISRPAEFRFCISKPFQAFFVAALGCSWHDRALPVAEECLHFCRGAGTSKYPYNPLLSSPPICAYVAQQNFSNLS
jgi:hypothetical protein